jgi:2-polyprenyl-3-methyl-5-hydroxy-6-metoxy-1,4-benzoquinol methylase
MPTPSDLSPASLRADARRVFTQGPFLLKTLQHLRPAICPFGPLLELIPPNASVLDVGCGGGLLLALIASRRSPRRLTGFDSSKEAIALATANLKSFPGTEPQFHRLDVGQPWPTGPFDVITLCDVLHHVPKEAQAALLRDCASALAPGGRFIYKDVYPEGHFRPNVSRLHDLVIARQIIHIPRFNQVRTTLENAGLSLLHHARHNTLAYGHELAAFHKNP